MNLPPLFWQIVFGHLAWGCVLASCAVVLIGRCRTLEAWQVWAIATIAFGIASPIGAWSASYWLGLCFQWPSPMLALCCALVVWRRGRGLAHLALMPTPMAVVIAVVGLVLYVDTAGWLPLGLYARGFGPGAAVCGLLGSAAAFVSILRRRRRDLSMALLLALTLFAVLRLPTGNVWDAVLDPLLWGWAVCAVVRRSVRRLRQRRGAAFVPSRVTTPY